MAPRCLSNLRCASRGLELALRQSWFISTPMPFRVDLTKSRMTIWDAGDETLMELHVSHPKHPVPPRSVADVARSTTNGCTDLIAMIKEVSTQTWKNKSDDDIIDGQGPPVQRLLMERDTRDGPRAVPEEAEGGLVCQHHDRGGASGS